MLRICVKNFGPITDGFQLEGGFIGINKVTVFIGRQGSGKSSLLKLLSTFLWLEKALVRGDFEADSLNAEAFKDTYLAYHCIGSYVKDDTEIVCESTVYRFVYRGCSFHAEKLAPQSGQAYSKPKILYVPVERNLIGTLRYSAVKGLPRNLFDFIGDFDEAGAALNGRWFPLPVGGYRYRYDVGAKESFVSNNEGTFEIRLLQAANGLQSVVPLSLVGSRNMEKVRRNINAGSGRVDYSFDELRKIRKNYEEEMAKLDPEIQQSNLLAYMSRNNPWMYAFYVSNGMAKSRQRQALSAGLSDKEERVLRALEFGWKANINSRFINIVEEPEQSLFPDSQRGVIFDLLAYANDTDENMLLMATHSPYLLPYINAAIKAAAIGEKAKELVPRRSFIEGKYVSVYELENGHITALGKFKDMSSDENLLNDALEGTNELYRSLCKAER